MLPPGPGLHDREPDSAPEPTSTMASNPVRPPRRADTRPGPRSEPAPDTEPPAAAPTGRPARPALLVLLLGLLVPAAAACGGEGEGPGAESPPPSTPVETAVAATDTLSATVRAVGTLEAGARVELKPELDGHVTSIGFEEGQEVRRGQVLARLDQDELEARARAARAAASRARTRAAHLERRLERNDSLLAAGAISEQTHDDVETEYESARAALEEAEANRALAEQRLEDATIRAPFDGRVGAREFDLGDYVQMGETLFTVVDDDPMEIEFSVPERHLGRLETGRPVRLSVRSRPGRPVTGRVTFVSPYVDPQNRSVQLKARVPNPGSELRAGQFANVTLELGRRAAVVVPEAAVVPGRDENVVFVVRGGTARRQRVELGQRERGVVEVLSGVGAGDTVVVAGHQRLSAGAPVSASGPTSGPADGGDPGEG